MSARKGSEVVAALLAAPCEGNSVIARRLGCSIATVVAYRRDLVEAGKIAPLRSRPIDDQCRQRIADAILAAPHESNADIAQRLGCSSYSVFLSRRALLKSGKIARRQTDRKWSDERRAAMMARSQAGFGNKEWLSLGRQQTGEVQRVRFHLQPEDIWGAKPDGHHWPAGDEVGA